MPSTVSHIALFGSSFNPPHNGHAAVLKFLLKKNLFDEIWLLPVYRHPFTKDLWPYRKRLKLTKLLLSEISPESPPLPPKKTACQQILQSKQQATGDKRRAHFKICQIEKHLGKNPSYMFDTVSALKKKYPDKKFTLVMGSDCKKNLPKWHRYRDLKKLIDFYFVPRRGLEKSPFPKVSSTEVRQKWNSGTNIARLVPPSIRDFLENERR